MKKNLLYLICTFSTFYLQTTENSLMNMVILIDETEFKNTDDFGAITQSLECGINDNAYPIFVSKSLFQHYLSFIERSPLCYVQEKHIPITVKFRGRQQSQQERAERQEKFNEALAIIAQRFTIKDLNDFYLFLPKNLFLESEIFFQDPESPLSDLEKKYGLKFQHMKTITLNDELVTDFAEWQKQAPTYSLVQQTLPTLFVSKNETLVHWNLAIEGHGSRAFPSSDPDKNYTFGIKMPVATQVLNFFKKQVRVDVLYLMSCYIRAHTKDLFSYPIIDQKIPESYPFDIIIQGIGETTVTEEYAVRSLRKECIMSMKKFFAELKNKHNKNYFEVLNKSNLINLKINPQNAQHLLPKNSELILPITSQTDKAIISITEAMSKKRKNSLKIPNETQLILLYPDKIDFPLAMNAVAHPTHPVRICSMKKDDALHEIKELDLTYQPVAGQIYSYNDQFDFLCTLFAPLYNISSIKKFLIEQVKFSEPQDIKFKKDVSDSNSTKVSITSLQGVSINVHGNADLNQLKDSNSVHIYFSCQDQGYTYFMYGTYNYSTKYRSEWVGTRLKELLNSTHKNQKLIFNRISQEEYKLATKQ